MSNLFQKNMSGNKKYKNENSKKMNALKYAL